MPTRSLKYYLTGFIALILAFATAAFCYHMIELDISRPQPISDVTDRGYSFTVVAMKGNKAVEQIHQCSGSLAGYTEADFPNHPIVLARTGRAIGDFRYYLTDADLIQVNSQLDSKPGQFPHDVQVKLLENNPVNKTQTVQVTIRADRTDFFNVYQVASEKVKPLRWKRSRGGGMILALGLMPIIAALSYLIWKKLILKVWNW